MPNGMYGGVRGEKKISPTRSVIVFWLLFGIYNEDNKKKEVTIMKAIIRRENINYLQRPLLLGAIVGVIFWVFQQLTTYLIHQYLAL